MKDLDDMLEDYMTAQKGEMVPLAEVFEAYLDEQGFDGAPEDRKRLMTTFMLGFQMAVNELIDLREDGKPWSAWAELRLDEVVEFVTNNLGRDGDDVDVWRLP